MKTALGISIVGIGILAAQGCAPELGGDEDVDSTKSALTNGAVYEIRGVQSNRCLDIAWGSTADSANVQIYDCWGGTAQQFKLEDMGSGYHRLRNVNSNKCLDVYNWSTSNGGNIVQYSCGTGNNQQFAISDTGGGKFKLISRHSGKALDVANLGTSNGSNVHQWSYGGGDNQKFYMNQVGGSSSSGGGSASGGDSSLPDACFADQMIHMMNAELAVAMAKEFREINPTRDLQVSGDRLAISSAGWSRCVDNCERVQAVLSMQDSSVNNYINQNVFNANSFKTNLVSQWGDQKILENGGTVPMPSAHTLTLSNTAPAYCGTDYVFNVAWNCTNCNTDTARIGNRLRFFRPENTVIDFRAENGKVTMDPTGSLGGDTGSGSGSCADTCSKFSKTNLTGQCCSCDGVSGTFTKSPTNGYVYLCD